MLHHGDRITIFAPVAFTTAYEEGKITWSIEGLPTAKITAEKNKQTGAYVLTLDGTKLPPGKHKVTIPLGNGEVVTFDLEVSE